MAGERASVPPDALEDIAYLARSPNRVRLLETLDSGAFSRRDLDAETGVASATIGRIVNELEDRGWAERTSEGTYTATATGSLVVSEFAPLVEAMDTIRTLGEAAAWLPIDELSIGISHFADATVRRSPPNNPHAGVEYLAASFRDTSEIRLLTFLDAPPPVAEAFTEGLKSGRQTAEFVLSGDLLDYHLDGDDPPPEWTRYIGDSLDVYRYGGDIPSNLFVFDESVIIMTERPSAGGGLVESDDESVMAAAADLIDRYRDDAEPVDAEVFE